MVNFSRVRPLLSLAALAALLAVLVLLGSWADRRLRTASAMLRLEQASAPGWLVHYREHAVTMRDFAPGGGRLYEPAGEPGRPLVLAHGMHEESIDEPRLVRLARALAGAGFSVLTPRVEGLAHYRLVPEDVARIDAAAEALARHAGVSQVPVLGISFAGGLALRAACEPGRGGAISRVIALGAHHDAERVSRFHLGTPALGPEGEPAQVEPHPYGRLAIWISLFGERRKGPLSAEERARAEARIEATRARLRGSSPSACPGPVRVPVWLIHGTGDRVVPYTETLWNVHQLAGQTPLRSLISPAIVHAEYEPPDVRERLTLISFLVDALW